jgi:hypothetical protein
LAIREFDGTLKWLTAGKNPGLVWDCFYINRALYRPTDVSFGIPQSEADFGGFSKI